MVLLAEIFQLSVAERILLVEQVWDSIAANPESVPLTESQRAELDRRLEAYQKNPEQSAPWEEVKSRITGGKQ